MVNFEIQTYKTFLFFTSLLAEWRPYQLVYGASTNLYASPSSVYHLQLTHLAGVVFPSCTFSKFVVLLTQAN